MVHLPSREGEAVRSGFCPVDERWNVILDEFKKYWVKWELEVQLTGIAHNIETAQKALAALDNRPEFGFNFDHSHLVWQLIDPVVFVKTFGLTTAALPMASSKRVEVYPQ